MGASLSCHRSQKNAGNISHTKKNVIKKSSTLPNGKFSSIFGGVELFPITFYLYVSFCGKLLLAIFPKATVLEYTLSIVDMKPIQ
jgi:hypothetical protein